MSLARKVRCTVASIADHGGRVYTVDLTPDRLVPSFRPGQFLHLTVDDYDPSGFWPESRVFSIASSPRDRSRVRICYAVKGRYTTDMEQALQVGRQVWIKLPYGDFVIDEARDAVLVAGGTGISAFTAFLEAHTPEQPRAVTLVYGARTPNLLIFQDTIMHAIARSRRLTVVQFCELEMPTPALAARDGGEIVEAGLQSRLAGPISLDVVWPLLANPASQVFYLSGPPGMLKAFGADLRARGIKPEDVRTDAWE
jgi:ferredoxin-NADP reductase